MFETNYKKVEAQVSNQKGSYQNLESAALLTSEEDFKEIFKALADIQTWIELGSGHGLGPLLFAHLNPHKKSIGIEFESPRYQISDQLRIEAGLSNVQFLNEDLLNCEIPIGDAYFFYFPTGMVLDRILFELGKRKGSFKIIAVESHGGDFLPRLLKEPWLKCVQKIPLKSPRHSKEALVFENISSKPASLHDLSFQKKYLLIGDEQTQWLGESYGLEWLKEDQFQLLVPPRTFLVTDILQVLSLDEITSDFHPALHLRHLPELRILTENKELRGSLRKIYVKPSFKLEISSGEQVEWTQIRQIFWENSLCYESSSGYFFCPHAV